MIFERLQLESDEQILSIVRRHWFFLLLQCLSIVVVMIFPLCALLVFSFVAPDILTLLWSTYTPHLFFFLACWLLINWMLLALIWTDHYLDVWTITNKRIIKIDQIRLFQRKIASFRLERLQDLSVEIDGIVATLLDYGTIHAETASGHDQDFTAHHLPNPHRIKSLILESADAINATTRAL